MQNMIKLVPYSALHYKDLLSYDLGEEQIRFTALPKENLVTRDILSDPKKTPVTVLLEDKAIGFFVFDAGPDKHQLTDNADALLLRSLSINPAFQGRGFGSQAMSVCREYVQHYLPGYNEIVLSVNEQNTAAYTIVPEVRLYRYR